MNLIKNFNSLATSSLRKICLEIIEEGLDSIQPEKIVQKNISIINSVLKVQDIQLDIRDFNRILLLGFGKGSAGISKHLEKMLGNFLTKGYVIDVEQEKFTNIKFTQGTHPLPSKTNLLFTKKTIEQLNNLTMKDLAIVIINGGGSALLELPYKVSLEKLIETNNALLKSGSDIIDMNIVRKHVSIVKGGGLAKLLYPAKIVSLIASDVPGNDLSTIASGPTVRDPSTKEEAFEVLKKYNLWEQLNLSKDYFLETPKEDKYFKNVANILIASNQTALLAMEQKAKELGFNAKIVSDKFQAEAQFTGKLLVEHAAPYTALLVGGETTVKVKGKGIGGRNQEVVLGALPYIDSQTILASFDSDGWDNSSFAGAIGDYQTLGKAKNLNLNPQEFLESNNTFSFFEKTGDGIITGRLPSNVSDLIIVIRK